MFLSRIGSRTFENAWIQHDATVHRKLILHGSLTVDDFTPGRRRLATRYDFGRQVEESAARVLEPFRLRGPTCNSSVRQRTVRSIVGQQRVSISQHTATDADYATQW